MASSGPAPSSNRPPITKLPSNSLHPSSSREKIRAESSMGWSPLKIQKRSTKESPSRPSSLLHTFSYDSTGEDTGDEPLRRTSSSYKHLKTNSLVSNSIFKQDASPQTDGGTPRMSSPVKPSGGLGWGSPRKSPGPLFKSGLDTPKKDGLRSSFTNESSEDDEETDLALMSPPKRLDFKEKARGRQSMGLANLPKQNKVSSSPFLKQQAQMTSVPIPSPTKITNPYPKSLSSESLASSTDSTTDDINQIIPEPTLPGPEPHLSPLESSATSADSSPADFLGSSVFSPYESDHTFASPPPFASRFPPASQRETPSTPPRPTSIPSHIRQETTASPSPKSNLKTKSQVSGSGGRERRKTVTFEERPEVSFFEKEASLEPGVESPASFQGEYQARGVEDSPVFSDQEDGSFEYDPTPQIPLPSSYLPTDSSYDLLPQSNSLPEDASYTDLTDLQNVSYGSYDGNSHPFLESDTFVNDLLQEADLLTPASVSSAQFPDQDQQERAIGDQNEDVYSNGDSIGLNPELELGPELEFPSHPKISHLDLPHLGSSPADPILMNGNVLEPSTHLPPPTSPPASIHPSLPAHALQSDVQAHQSGPLPDPFLTLQTLHHILTSPPRSSMKRSASSSRSISSLSEGLAFKLPQDEQGVPYGRTHHSERRIVRDVLKDGIGLETKGKPGLEVEEKEDSFTSEVEEDEDEDRKEGSRVNHPLFSTRGLVLNDLGEKDVFGEMIEVAQSPVRRVSSSTPSKLLLEPALGCLTLDDNPYSFPEFGMGSSVFSPLEISSIGPSSNLVEFGKPSSSADRLKLEEFGGAPSSIGRNGSITSSAGANDSISSRSSSGRSPRLTRESVRRRMDARKREMEERTSSEERATPVKGSALARPLEGLGIGLPDGFSTPVLSEYEGLPPVSDPSFSSSIAKETSVAVESRPPLPNRTSTLSSAKDILLVESALSKLAAGMKGLFTFSGEQPSEERIGEVKERSVILETKMVPSGASSTPVEEYPSFLAVGTSPTKPIPSLPSTNSIDQAKRDSELMPPPPVPSKIPASPSPSNIRAPSPAPSWSSGNLGPRSREQAILASRKDRRAEESVGSPGRSATPRPRRKTRRSLSTGDVMAEEGGGDTKRHTITGDFGVHLGLMDQLTLGENEGEFGEKLVQEIDKIAENKNHRYRLVQHQQITASDEKTVRNRRAGDLDKGKSWRSVKRPSDMNEYAQEIREIRSREKPGRAHAKVFVKIVGITDVNVPLPNGEPPQVRIALNNGLHSVETGTYPLRQKVDIGQEFELLGLDNLEFSFAVKVKKDANIANRLKAITAPASCTVLPTTPTKQSGFRKLMASPRRPKSTPPSMVARPEPVQDELVRYLGPDGTLAVVKVVFKDIASRCNGQVLSLHLPLTGKWNEQAVAQSQSSARSGGPEAALANRPRTIGRMELQLIMIPSLPGLLPDQLPQSLEDAIIGLRHVRWHKMDYFAGVLTQLGGDCSSWRRRRMRIVGGTLEASNDITGKITARINISKMTSVVDNNNNNEESTNHDVDRSMSIERSFTLTFESGEDIQFYADSDKDKEEWIAHLNELLGRVPNLPLWAELLWVKNHPTPQEDPNPIPSNP